MADTRTNTDPLAREKQYTKCLFVFVHKMYKHTLAFKQQLAALKIIHASLSERAEHIRQLIAPMPL